MTQTKKSVNDYQVASFGEQGQIPTSIATEKNGVIVGGIDASSKFERLPVGTSAAGTAVLVDLISAESVSVSVGTIAVIQAGTISTTGTVGSVTNVGTVKGIDSVAAIAAGTFNTLGTLGSVTNVGSLTNVGTMKGLDTFAGTAKVAVNDLISGEDQTNDVLKVEGQFLYYHHVGTAGSTSGTIKATAGFLHSVVYNTHTSGGTYALYDSVGTSATVMAVVAPGAALPPLTSIYDVKCTTGITVVSGSACDLTFAYR